MKLLKVFKADMKGGWGEERKAIEREKNEIETLNKKMKRKEKRKMTVNSILYDAEI